MCSLHRYDRVHACIHALIMLEIVVYVYAQITVPAPELDAMR